jgi:hypothetical protein
MENQKEKSQVIYIAIFLVAVVALLPKTDITHDTPTAIVCRLLIFVTPFIFGCVTYVSSSSLKESYTSALIGHISSIVALFLITNLTFVQCLVFAYGF